VKDERIAHAPPARGWIEAIDHVQLAMPAGGEAQARAFYGGLLGLAEVPKPGDSAKRGGCWFEQGPVRLHLGVEADYRPARKAHPALVVPRFEDLCAHLEAAGVPVESGAPMAGRARGFVADPFGNRIELMAACAAPLLRAQLPEDASALADLHRAAFGGELEAALVGALGAAGAIAVGLVAERQGEVLGHIVFSPLELETSEVRLAALAPMAVRPGEQSRGIGSALVRAGLERCRALGFDAVVVLGHPDYYPRFGFRPASGLGLRAPWDVPGEAFMALELAPGVLGAARGTVRYHPAFSAVDPG
jgi:putative acetyltransferase